MSAADGRAQENDSTSAKRTDEGFSRHTDFNLGVWCGVAFARLLLLELRHGRLRCVHAFPLRGAGRPSQPAVDVFSYILDSSRAEPRRGAVGLAEFFQNLKASEFSFYSLNACLREPVCRVPIRLVGV
jgi:hypothetical protein